MKRVQVKDVGVKLNGEFHYKGEQQTISDDEFQANKEYLEILEDIKETTDRTIEIIVKDENIDINEITQKAQEFVDNYNKEPENPEKNTVEDDEELKQLREKAKAMDIKNAHNMKKETLIAKITEIEQAGAGEPQNPTGE